MIYAACKIFSNDRFWAEPIATCYTWVVAQNLAFCTAITATLMSVEMLSQHWPFPSKCRCEVPRICALHRKCEVLRDVYARFGKDWTQ